MNPYRPLVGVSLYCIRLILFPVGSSLDLSQQRHVNRCKGAGEHRPVGTYPHVALAFTAFDRIIEQTDLRTAGLWVEVPPPPPVDVRRFQRRGPKPRRIPSYPKALASVRLKDDGEPDRSAADLLFAITCLRWRPPFNPDEIFELLMQESEKAGEKNAGSDEDYVRRTIEEALRRA